MTVDIDRRCAQHRAPAGWRCTSCEAFLCVDCAALKRVYPTEVPVCTRCLGLAEALRVHRRARGGLLSWVPGAFLFPFRGDGFLTSLGLAFFLTILSYAPWAGAVLGVAGIIITAFAVVRETSRGLDGVVLDQFTDVVGSIMAPLVRFGAVTLPLWLPLLAFRLAFGSEAFTAARGLFLGAVGVVWSGMAFIAAGAGSSLITILNPLHLFRCVSAIGRDFLVYLGVWFTLALLAIPVSLVSLGLLLVPIPVFTRVVGLFLTTALILIGARVAGLVLYLHGDSLEWGMAADYLEPVLGSAEPRGVLPERPTSAADASPREALELPPALSPIDAEPLAEAEVVPSLAALHPAPRAPPPFRELDPATLPSLQRELAQRIREAVRSGDTGLAMDAWKAASPPPTDGLTCSELAWVGRAAAAAADHDTALAAFEAAATSQTPSAPSEVAAAQVLLARLLDERLGRREEARAWMQRVADSHRETDAGAFAQQWLRR